MKVDKDGAQSDLPRLLRSVAFASAIFIAIYLFFLTFSISFPFIKAGADLVEKLKHDLARHGDPFQAVGKADPVRLRVMAFGDSKILTAFVPAVFDSELASAGLSSVISYNFGLPGDHRFVADLELMAARGVAPDIALLTVPWPAEPDPGTGIFRFIDNDQEVLDGLFPFRRFPRDFLIMAMESRGSFQSFRQLYYENGRTIQQVAKDRGYYFIARQSHFSKDELPPGLRLPHDTPFSTSPRDVPRGSVYKELSTVMAARNIRCLFIPLYFRNGEFALPPATNIATVKMLAGSRSDIVGPDYFLYPNNFFSDPTHVNSRGADVYTRTVAGLFATWLKQHKTTLR